ncbi:beta-propeller fold lactonase family protein [Novosphingobium flavum]|uniref:Beta-propeller fold lactonase family protein n=1 Tax=Novosphingobium flavum TaxID=1778672 RepID=A0A7X1FQV3_9SPHN|nr:beta-propeller fold lactonase family protein [Novosphingobium flavum]MBC2665305.1 beta-propeller fold lactonase family protein [Novosphingobium flavum]
MTGPLPAERTTAFAGLGARLLRFGFDPDTGLLSDEGETALPARLRSAFAHPRLPVLYAACGDGGAAPGERPYWLAACARGEDGGLGLLGEPVRLLSRPIDVTVDPAGDHVLIAYSAGPGLTVHRLRENGMIGPQLPVSGAPDWGSVPHQVRVLPECGLAVIVARGMPGFGSARYVEGALRLARFSGGVIEAAGSVAPAEAAAMGGFNPRNIAFHPAFPRAYVTLEGQNRLCQFELTAGLPCAHPVKALEMLTDRADLRERQVAGTLAVHPSGRFVYAANRNDGYLGGHSGPSWETPDPVPVFPGGENGIAGYRLSADGRLEERIQNVPSGGLHPRTFAIDPSGRWLVVGNYAPSLMPLGDRIAPVAAGFVIFAIGEDGILRVHGRHDIAAGRERIWWSGLAAF